MSQTRYTPDELDHDAEFCALEDEPVRAAMLRQAAADARVIEQLRAWLKTQQKACFPQDIGVVTVGVLDISAFGAYRATVAELDRLQPQPSTRPADGR